MTKQKMSSEEVINVAIAALEEVKGADILTIDVRDKTSIADYMLICTGTSNRQLTHWSITSVTRSRLPA